ncbi:hypothetical protein [Novisyntrophococcus fermenticellae]|uniref:hypothetical protein n=1 Tax=Novisyntrophococcus fermenticellae TaxID=2068655 RepID=UPI001E31C587|nr:hypothetical protein [Novisyntrophococcus fermenticellae]
MNKSGYSDPTAEDAIGTVEKENKKIRKCRHVERVGSTAVYVTEGCPHAKLIQGKRVSWRGQCLRCREE